MTLSFQLWSSTRAKLSEEFKQGDHVIALAKTEFWVKGGTLSMQVLNMRHVGLGDLLERLERLRAQLASEGLFDADRKKPLPFLPACIGLVTGKDSDAEKDVLRNAQLRWPSVVFRVRHAAVQGDRAASDVAAAIRELDADPEVEVIIVARGGGDFQNLLAFSDEALLRTAAACETPLVSAIGHEADRPLLDEVADLRASTPTDAAKRVVPDVAEELARVQQARARIGSRVTAMVTHEIERLGGIRSRPVLADPGWVVAPALGGADPLGRPRVRADRLPRRARPAGPHRTRRAAARTLAEAHPRARVRDRPARRRPRAAGGRGCGARHCPPPHPERRLGLHHGRSGAVGGRGPRVEWKPCPLPPTTPPTSAAPDVSGLSYEQARDELVRVVTELEQGAATLEESLALWERGEALAKRCEEWLLGAKERLDKARAAAARRRRRPAVTQAREPRSPEHRRRRAPDRRRTRPRRDARRDRRTQGRRERQAPLQPDRAQSGLRPARLARRRRPRRARRRAPDLDRPRSHRLRGRRRRRAAGGRRPARRPRAAGRLDREPRRTRHGRARRHRLLADRSADARRAVHRTSCRASEADRPMGVGADRERRGHRPRDHRRPGVDRSTTAATCRIPATSPTS